MNRLYSLLQTTVSAAALVCLSDASHAAAVSNEGELKSALQAGNDVTLTANIVLTENLPDISSGNFMVDGGSYSIGVGVDAEGTVAATVAGFKIGSGATVDFQNLTINNLSQALSNGGTINNISSVVFDGNYVSVSGGDATGGAISNTGTIGTISNSEFKNNSATAEGGNAYGGAIANTNGGTLNLINTSFYNNYAEVKGDTALDTEDTPATHVALGGAIYSNGDVNITAQGKNVVFSGNQILKPTPPSEDAGGEGGGEATGEDEEVELAPTSESSAIAMDGGNLNFITDGGNIIFDDVVSSVDKDYNMKISGNGSVIFNNTVTGVGDFVLDSSKLTLGTGASLGVANYTVNGNSLLTVTVDPDSLSASTITVTGDVVGTTRVIVQATSETVVSPNQSILYVAATGDDKNTAGDFVVYRVYGSPYMWVSKYYEATPAGEGTEEGTGESEGGEAESGDVGEVPGVTANADDAVSEPDDGAATAPGTGEGDGSGGSGVSTSGWYLSMTDESNPDFRPMAPEIASFLALHSAALEQNRGVINSIRNSVSSSKLMLKRYGLLYEDGYSTRNVSRIWANPVYRYVQLTAPQEVEATIAGFDMGMDLQTDASNKLGIFGSYRYGTYDVGKDGYFKANMDSTLEISSYLLGLYYRYDYNNFWMFSTAYVGKQHAEMETDDKLKADADGTEFGVGVEMGYAFIPGQNWTLEPSLGIFYTGIDYDDMEDKYGKSADYKMLNHVEGEFGIKLEKTIEHVYGYSKLYIKPSVIQTLNFGNEVTITHLNTVDTIDDQTLGRIEVGGRYALDNRMSLYGYVNYTTGTDYDDIAAGLGFNYRWY